MYDIYIHKLEVFYMWKNIKYKESVYSIWEVLSLNVLIYYFKNKNYVSNEGTFTECVAYINLYYLVFEGYVYFLCVHLFVYIFRLFLCMLTFLIGDCRNHAGQVFFKIAFLLFPYFNRMLNYWMEDIMLIQVVWSFQIHMNSLN